MALNTIKASNIEDGTIAGIDFDDNSISSDNIAALSSSKLSGALPALNGSAVTGLTAANLTGALPALDGTALTGIVSDFTPLENQMSRLGLHLGAVDQLTKYNMIDQVIDNYEDATGVTVENSSPAIPAIPYSCRFTRASSDDMSKASLSGGSTTKGTQSWWFKRASISSDQRMWANYSGSSTARNQVGWQAANKIYIQHGDSTVRISTQTFTSTTDWVHIVVAWDSSQGTAADRLKVYIDGSEITAWDTNNAVGQNSDIRANNGKIYLGRRETSSLYFDGYLADFRSVDGQQLTPSTFGQTVSGVWKPKTVTGLTYGTNGFYLDFADSSALGNDVSGNNIDFTVANLTSGDRSTDTPQPTATSNYSNQQPTLELTEGYTYKFDTSDSTNATHHFKFSTTADGTHGSGVDYTTGVTYNGTPGSAGAYTQIVVAASAPTLYYWCHHHASMGGTANTPAEAATTSMRYRVDTKNQSASKVTRIHGTSLAWS